MQNGVQGNKLCIKRYGIVLYLPMACSLLVSTPDVLLPRPDSEAVSPDDLSLRSNVWCLPPLDPDVPELDLEELTV
jgi:hypothetical protein